MAKAQHEHSESQSGEAGHGFAGHHHHHAPTDFGRLFLIAIALNSGFVAIEFVYGYIANSTALMADAGHNLSDVLGLILAWGAAWLSRQPPSARFTYGLRNASILAALSNAILLLLACGAIAWEALHRLSQPGQVAGLTVTLVATLGILVNGISAWLFIKGSKVDLNVRGAYLHMLADTAVSLGVVIAGIIMLFTGWNWVDPAISLVIVLVIVAGTWSLLRESTELALGAVPKQIDPVEVETFLRAQAGVSDVHDLHIWAIGTTDVALTAHLVLPDGYPGDLQMAELSRTLRKTFGVGHTTLQIGTGAAKHGCALNDTDRSAHDHSNVHSHPHPHQHAH